MSQGTWQSQCHHSRCCPLPDAAGTSAKSSGLAEPEGGGTKCLLEIWTFSQTQLHASESGSVSQPYFSNLCDGGP